MTGIRKGSKLRPSRQKTTRKESGKTRVVAKEKTYTKKSLGNSMPNQKVSVKKMKQGPSSRVKVKTKKTSW